MAAGDIVPVPGAQFEETLASASPDMLRAMIREFAQRMMDADVEVACNAGYGEVTPDRVNSRNGYRRREWDTRAGTIELAIPKLRQGSYFPGFLEHRRRAERALASVVATSYLLGVSTRRVEKLAASLGVVGLSKSQVSVMAGELDELVDSFRNRPLDRGPYTFCWIDALTQKVREGGRTVNVHALIATEAMRTMFLLMSELHAASCCEETYSSAGLSSIARASFGVRLWLRRINLGLEKGEEGLSH